MKGYSFGELVKLAEAALPKTDNAVSATKLQTARTIGGVAFDGTGNINLPGVNIAGTQNTSGRAAVASTADKLTTARNINGVAFDGTKNIDISAGAVGTYTKAEIDAKDNLKLDKTGGTVTGDLALTQTGPTPLRLTRTSGDNLNIQFTTGGNSFFFGLGVDGVFRVGNTNNLISTGNKVFHEGLPPTAAQVGLGNVNNTADSAKNVLSATKLTTPRSINGVNFDGTANITVADNTKVPTTRKVNNKPLSADVNLTATDVNAMFNSSNAVSDPDNRSSRAVRYDPSASNPTNHHYAGITYGNNGNVTGQIMTNFNTGETYVRAYNNAWTPYAKIYTSVHKPTASDVGALPSGGTAAAATKLATPRAINGVNFDGSAAITITAAANGGTSAACSGNAATATTLQNARTINGVSFNGSANITITAAANGGTSSACSGNAATATKLATARTIGGTNFDGTANIDPMRIRYQDTRATEFTPATARTYLQVTFQNGNSNGVGAAAADYYNLLHIPQYNDSSGGYGSQIAFTKDGKMRHRRGISDTAWGSWNVLYSTGNKPTAADVGALAVGGTAAKVTINTTFTGKYPMTVNANGVLYSHPSVQFEGSTGTLTATKFVGNGASLTGITASQVGALASNGTAVAATKLATPRAINGVNFDGTANISIADLVGSRYASGGVEKPNFFGAGKLAYRMVGSAAGLAGEGFGGYSDVIWVSSYTGGDVKVSNALIMSKGGNRIGFRQQAYDSTTWGPLNEIYHTNKRPTAAEVGALASNGTAVAATKLATPRAINGVNFDGSANITITAAANGGNAATATTLQTARTINGVSFNGSANITITAAANGGTSAACSGNAATATALQTARTIGGVSFNGTANIVPTDISPATSTATGFYNLAWFSGTRIYHTNSKMTFQPSSGALTITGYLNSGPANINGDLWVKPGSRISGTGSGLTDLRLTNHYKDHIWSFSGNNVNTVLSLKHSDIAGKMVTLLGKTEGYCSVATVYIPTASEISSISTTELVIPVYGSSYLSINPTTGNIIPKNVHLRRVTII